ncbi:uncharacterized protein EV422DRAFT_494512 [Fimicolochytrium jonesii]|uniref:uncharacterized protein n=1 Tax=Fimicolochytrium jonesii TaxID=1396493 RepID=UPI0022FF29D1|nr:uncharacterized protein EV422DRAFT_494512 [Fimicolochytrium jonesii]KAI8822993.1 hypothetical protein EV422DRAFT_494512 [Fimicolochytrium jonesii]
MGQTFYALTPGHLKFIAAQHMFFVATAPLSATASVNVSPKGYDSFHVLSPTRVAYVDLTGSGVETISHARENGRITIMFIAVDGPPNILRLYGRCTVHLRGTPGFEESLPQHLQDMVAARAAIVVDVSRVTSVCGYAVPFYQFVKQRETLIDHWVRKGESALEPYHRLKNSKSIDGLPGLWYPWHARWWHAYLRWRSRSSWDSAVFFCLGMAAGSFIITRPFAERRLGLGFGTISFL